MTCQLDILSSFPGVFVPWRSPLLFPSQPWGLLIWTSQWYLDTLDQTILHLSFVVLDTCMYTAPSLCITPSSPSAETLYWFPNAAEKLPQTWVL